MSDKIIVDFDETLTVENTVRLLTTEAIESRREPDRSQFMAEWTEMVDAYDSAYHRTIGTELNKFYAETLAEFLELFAEIERKSVDRVMASKVLAGLTIPQIHQLSKKILLKNEVSEVLALFHLSGFALEILSANWSKRLIEGVVSGLSHRIWSNSLIFDEKGISTGELELSIVSAQDKYNFLEKIRSKTGRTIYVGDSITDLLAILSADIGILFGDNALVQKVIKFFDLPTKFIFDDDILDRKTNYSGTILRLNSWKTLVRFLLNENNFID